MQRVYGNVEDEIVPQIDAAAMKEGLTRAKWISNAIDAYLHRTDARDSIKEMHLNTALEEKGQRIAHLEELIRMKDAEIMHLRELSTALTSKIIPALPPAREEPRKKSRWRLW